MSKGVRGPGREEGSEWAERIAYKSHSSRRDEMQRGQMKALSEFARDKAASPNHLAADLI
jgi:hypothetical protein